MAIPRWEPRLRLAALWPLWIGLGTLEQLAAADDPLDPARPVKIGARRRLSDPGRVVDGGRRRRALTRLHERGAAGGVIDSRW